MRRLIAAVLVLLAAAAPAVAADDAATYVRQVPMLPLPEGDHPDIDAFVGKHWAAYYRAPGGQGFGRNELRVGRLDLDDDGEAELFVMIDADNWGSEFGKPLVVATWMEKRWVAVGWSWADTDTVFATREVTGGWRTIDTGAHLLRWKRKTYQEIRKAN